MYKLRVYFTVCPHLFMDKAKQQRTKPPQPHQLSYLFSTSNHNLLWSEYLESELSYISFLHQSTTTI